MKPRVLILDEEGNFNTLKRVLSKAGYEIDFAPSEIWALDKVGDGLFCLFFVAVDEMARLEVIKRALEIDPELCVIAMGNQPTIEIAVASMKAGAYDYLAKPIDKDRLKTVVDMAIDKPDSHGKTEEKGLYKQLAITDGLTEVYNHRYFHEILSREIERAKRYPQHVSLLMADVDHFKKYNDANGHQAGDMALKIVAQNIAQQLRQVDLVARYGGEEFAIILPNASKQTAHTLASRIRSNIAQVRIEGEEVLPGKHLTVSIGLAAFPDEAKNKDNLISRADKALYRAKANGRNRVFAFW